MYQNESTNYQHGIKFKQKYDSFGFLFKVKAIYFGVNFSDSDESFFFFSCRELIMDLFCKIRVQFVRPVLFHMWPVRKFGIWWLKKKKKSRVRWLCIAGKLESIAYICSENFFFSSPNFLEISCYKNSLNHVQLNSLIVADIFTETGEV